MRKLVTASFFRLWKEKMFWLAFAFMSVGCVWYNWVGYNEMGDSRRCLEGVLFCMLPVSGFALALLIGMRLGTEYEEHTIRNKLIAGYSRTQIYFAESIACAAASMILMGTMLLFSSALGLLLQLEFQASWTRVLLLFFCCMLMAAVFSAMFVGIGMNVESRAASIVASLALMFAILLLASLSINLLSEPPMIYSNISITAEGGVQPGEMVANPDYVDGIQRRVYALIADLLPTGQAIQMNLLEFDRAARWPALSMLMLIVATLAGYLPFRRRDVR